MLSEDDLRDADLSYSNLSGANLTDADLTDADLSGSNLGSARLNAVAIGFGVWQRGHGAARGSHLKALPGRWLPPNAPEKPIG